MHHAFLYISLLSVHVYDLKLPNVRFCRGWEHKTTIFTFFCEVRYSPLKSNSWKNRQLMTNYKNWNESDEFERARILFFWLKFLSLLPLLLLKLFNVAWQGGKESSDPNTQDDSKECMLWFCFILGLNFISFAALQVAFWSPWHLKVWSCRLDL